MPRVTVYNQQGENVGSLTLAKEVFGIEPNNSVMFDAVVLNQANRRQDTAKTKKRDEVSGGGKKPWRQKGTGRARQGSTRSPQWRHGGIVFGPTGEQNHSIKMNKKERVLALKSALSQKVLDKELKVVDQFKFENFKTKDMVASLTALKADKKVLFVITEDSMNTEAVYSAINLPNVYGIIYFDEVNVYDLLNCTNLVMTKEAVKEIEEAMK